MRIVVAGGSGFIGEPLVWRLSARGHDVAVLTRSPRRLAAGRPVEWDPPAGGSWTEEVSAADAVVNLAGESIGDHRWSEARKREILASRIDATGALVDALRTAPRRERTLVNASAIGIYGDRGDEILDESAARGPGFLGDVVEKWEAAARGAESHARVVLLRFGVVLSAGGGALVKMMLPFRFGAGGPIGNGQQWLSWITRGDVIRMIEWAIEQPGARGVFNAVAPEPVQNRDFARVLGRAMHRPAILPTPALALKLAFGQMGEELLLSSQRVVPRRAEDSGFTFEARTIAEGVEAALRER
jgi:uncharacterized protein (TIGR01777 family)